MLPGLLQVMRHYYDIYCLLALPEVQEFIGTSAYDLGAYIT